MAATNYTPISLYYSTTASATPSAGNLVNGELAINITDGKLYYKDNGGTVQLLASKDTGAAGGSNTNVQFNSSGALAGSANFTWNGSTVAITGALTATANSVFSSTGALTISKGTTGEQPGSPVTGMLRYNTTTNQFEGYSGASPAWNPVGGASLSNDTSTSSDVYPLFANATTGAATTVYTSNAKLLYKPSTGELKVTAPVASNGILVNNTTATEDYTIASGSNGLSVGPFTVDSGVTITVSSGQRWLVL